ncbi:MAG TPA: tripartite tricarboxylate transporter substrate binding protein [Thermodesulfobacteriota bacterium]|nr:tripartite tricarboxylate transporter substrate binding protein [Thermodesulfobacteriota bacterium]
MEKVILKKRFIALLVFGVFASFLIGVHSPPSWAAEKPYPNKPINMIVSYAPASGTDLGSKVMADKMSEFLGQPLISVYKPGGGGSLGAAFVAKARPDGYTVLVGSVTPLVLSPIVKKMDFQLEDFTLLGTYSKIPIWVVVKKDARRKTLKDFIEEVKKTPGFQVGTYGKLTAADFVLELLNKYAGIKMVNVPFKSSGEAMTTLLGGHVEACILSGAAGHLDAGSARILAAAEEERLDGLPDVPTFKELGYPILMPSLYCFAFQKDTPKQIVDRFQDAQNKAIQKYPKEIKEGLRRVEQWAEFLTPQDTLKKFRDFQILCRKMAQELGVQAK